MTATTTENPLDLYLNTADITDGSHIVGDPSEVISLIGEAKTGLKSALKTSRELTLKLKTVAYVLTSLCLRVRDKDGYPIMSYEGTVATDTMKSIMETLYAEVFPIPEDADKATRKQLQDERTANLAKVRLFRSRVFIRWAVESYVLENHSWTAEDKALIMKPGYLKWGTPDKDFSDVVSLVGQAPVFMHAPCAEIYKRSGLVIPEDFGGPPKNSGGSGDLDTKAKNFSPDKWKEQSVGVVTRISALQAAESVRAFAFATIAKLIDGDSEITDRPNVTKTFKQVQVASTLAVKFLDGKITEPEADALRKLVTPDLMAAVKAEMEAAAKAATESTEDPELAKATA